MRRRSEDKSLENRLANVLMVEMVEIVGREVAPTNDFAQTLEFRREDVVTNQVLRVAPLEDDTVPYTPVELDEIRGEPSAPYDLIEIKAVVPIVPRALRASSNLVAVDDPVTHHEPTLARVRRWEPLIAIGLLSGALGFGVALSFLVAAFGR